MAETLARTRSFTNPIHAILLAFPVALYPAALLSDITYLNTAEIQWTNFSAWLLAAGELFAGLLLIGALVSLVRSRSGRATLYFLLVLALLLLATLLRQAKIEMPSAVMIDGRRCGRLWHDSALKACLNRRQCCASSVEAICTAIGSLRWRFCASA